MQWLVGRFCVSPLHAVSCLHAQQLMCCSSASGLPITLRCRQACFKEGCALLMLLRSACLQSECSGQYGAASLGAFWC